MRKLFTIAILFTFLLYQPALAQEAEPPPPPPEGEIAPDVPPAETLPPAPEGGAAKTTTYFLPSGEVIADNRIKLMMYNETDVFTITTRYGYQTNIVFAPQEAIETISVGDRSLWQIIPAGNRIFIRPMEEDATTNMTVLTNKRSYQFDLTSLGPAMTEGNIYVATFIYPEDQKPAPADSWTLGGAPPPAEQADAAPLAPPPSAVPPEGMPLPPASAPPPQAAVPMAQTAPGPLPAEWYVPKPGEAAPPPAAHAADTAPAPQPLVTGQPLAPAPAMAPAVPVYPNYNYTYSGADELAPLQVYDDGKYTYLKYRDWNQPPPSVYVVDAAGREAQVGFSVKGDFMFIEAVAPEMLLRSASGAIRIYNEMLNPQ
jgi:type IV secretory pathway VirB9-like protein